MKTSEFFMSEWEKRRDKRFSFTSDGPFHWCGIKGQIEHYFNWCNYCLSYKPIYWRTFVKLECRAWKKETPYLRGNLSLDEVISKLHEEWIFVDYFKAYSLLKKGEISSAEFHDRVSEALDKFHEKAKKTAA